LEGNANKEPEGKKTVKGSHGKLSLPGKRDLESAIQRPPLAGGPNAFDANVEGG